MNSRDRLIDATIILDSGLMGKDYEDYKRDAAALRELDKLLEDARKLCMPHFTPDPVKGCPGCEWAKRAKQAGY